MSKFEILIILLIIQQIREMTVASVFLLIFFKVSMPNCLIWQKNSWFSLHRIYALVGDIYYIYAHFYPLLKISIYTSFAAAKATYDLKMLCNGKKIVFNWKCSTPANNVRMKIKIQRLTELTFIVNNAEYVLCLL